MHLSQAIQANNLSPNPVFERPNHRWVLRSNVPVTFDASNSYDPDNTNIINYYWWYVDGQLMASGPSKSTFTTTFTIPAGSTTSSVQIKLKVQDNENTRNFRINTLTIYSESYYLVNTYYYLTDHLGSIRTTIDHFGNVVGYDDYYPFGLPMPGRSSNLANPNDLNKFTGHERDSEGGLMIDYMLARNYNPEIGRFMSLDPLANKFPAWSPYNYTFNSPLIYTDPDERAPWFVGALIGAGLDIAVQTVIEGKSVGEIDVGSVLLSAGSGALGAGLASKSSKLLNLAIDAGGSMASQLYDNGSISRENTSRCSSWCCFKQGWRWC